jgi:hypothetical protein
LVAVRLSFRSGSRPFVAVQLFFSVAAAGRCYLLRGVFVLGNRRLEVTEEPRQSTNSE